MRSSVIKFELNLSEYSKLHVKKFLVQRLKFGEYFYFNKEIINRKKFFETSENILIKLYLRKCRHSIIKLSDFNLKGLINKGSYGNNYLIKRKNKFYNLKTVSNIENDKYNLDLSTINYIGLLKERDALLNCGGLWTPKVYKTFDFHNLPIAIAIEAVSGWSLKHCVHVIHAGSDSHALIYGKRHKMTLKLKKSLITSTADLIDPIKSEIIPIIRFWMAELLVAVRFIHKQGILHRDLHPETVTINERGHIKLTDFSLTSLLYKLDKKDDKSIFNHYNPINTSTELTEVIISPDPYDIRRRSFNNRLIYPFKIFGFSSYSAPELHSTSTVAEYTSTSDYWSSGCIFFYMLFMINPFDIVSNSACYNSSTTNLDQKAKFRLSTHSLLNPIIVARRCWNIPSAKQLLLDVLLSVEPSKRLDDNFNESKWFPETLEFFSPLNFDNLQHIDAPFKPIIYDRENCFEYLLPLHNDDLISEIMTDFSESSLSAYTTPEEINV